VERVIGPALRQQAFDLLARVLLDRQGRETDRLAGDMTGLAKLMVRAAPQPGVRS
jgi:hypothetical protein